MPEYRAVRVRTSSRVAHGKSTSQYSTDVMSPPSAWNPQPSVPPPGSRRLLHTPVPSWHRPGGEPGHSALQRSHRRYSAMRRQSSGPASASPRPSMPASLTSVPLSPRASVPASKPSEPISRVASGFSCVRGQPTSPTKTSVQRQRTFATIQSSTRIGNPGRTLTWGCTTRVPTTRGLTTRGRGIPDRLKIVLPCRSTLVRHSWLHVDIKRSYASLNVRFQFAANRKGTRWTLRMTGSSRSTTANFAILAFPCGSLCEKLRSRSKPPDELGELRR